MRDGAREFAVPARLGDLADLFDPAGKLIGLIEFPEGPANLAWGGVDRRTLFVTARTSVYRLPMNAVGVPVTG